MADQVSQLRGLPDRQRDLVRQLLRRGWTLKTTGGGHLKLSHPSGNFVWMSRTPSDHRGWRNLLSHIRRIEKGDAA